MSFKELDIRQSIFRSAASAIGSAANTTVNNVLLDINSIFASGTSGQLLVSNGPSSPPAFSSTVSSAITFSASGTAVLVTNNVSIGGQTNIGTPSTNSGSYALIVEGNSTTGNSYGIKVQAGTNSSDTSLLIDNAAGSLLFNVNGAGAVSTSHNVLDDGSGDITIAGNATLTALAGVGTRNVTVSSTGLLTTGATSFTAPTPTTYINVSAQTGIVITSTTTSISATAGSVYSNNGNNYTVLNTVASSHGPVFFSGSGATSGTAFTFVSGTGTSTITATAATDIQLLGTYTTPANALYLEVEMCAGGGSGGVSGTSLPGQPSYFGVSYLITGGGGAGAQVTSGVAGNIGGGGGASTALPGGVGGYSIGGAPGASGNYSGVAGAQGAGGIGGTNPFGGAGSGGAPNGANGDPSSANTGAGGGGESAGSATSTSGSGGGAGSYIYAIIGSPATSYYYSVGLGGTNTTTSSYYGAAGIISIVAKYQ